jgi:hypothetical protein
MCNCNKGGSGVKPKNAPQPQAVTAFNFSSQSKRKKVRAAIQPPEIDDSGSKEILENLTGETFAEKCQTFAYVLGLENPVPEKVLIAALDDPNYASRLLIHRGDAYMYELLNNPPQKLAEISTKSLISKAGKALLNWGLSGFPTVSKVTLKKREDACLACPNLVESSSALQKITASSKITNEIGHRTGNKSCALCGCVIRNKIRLETETCPEEVAETPGINRWDEPVKF